MTEALPLSLLNDYLYCPRRAALKIVEGTPPKDEYHVTKDGKVEAGKNGEGVAVIKANRIVWEIPAK